MSDSRLRRIGVYEEFLKRPFDALSAGSGLIVLLPLLLVVSVLIIVTDGFPVFYKQERIGRNGKKFRIFKFRTMSTRIESEGASFDLGSSARVTTMGAILRKTKIDELPQLLNVLLGDMSLIGPRPEIAKWTVEYPESWRVVHQVRPGISDLASIEYRNEEQLLAQSEDPHETYKHVILPAKLALGERYVNEISLVADIKILLATLLSVAGVDMTGSRK